MDNFLLEVKDADVYRNGRQVLFSIDWTMLENENWAVVGNNGSGKTTFMKLVFGEIIPVYGGRVHWFGHRSERRIMADIRSRIGYVSAEYQEDYSYNIPGWAVVASGFFSSVGLYEAVSGRQKETALQWMDFLGIQHLAHTGFRRMSYGEARRTLLARALITQPDLLILDEPCAGLDIPTREKFLETLEKLTQTQTRLIYVTHHIEEIMPWISHVLFIKDGRCQLQGKKEELLRGEVLSQAFDCEITINENSGRYWITESRLKNPEPMPAD